MPLDAYMTRSAADGTWDFTKTATGDVMGTTTAQHAVLTQLCEHRASAGVPGWIWDSTAGSGDAGTHGSLLYLVTDDTPEQRSQFTAWALEALDVLVRQGLISEPRCTLQPQQVPGRLDAVVSWVDQDQLPQSITVTIGFP